MCTLTRAREHAGGDGSWPRGAAPYPASTSPTQPGWCCGRCPGSPRCQREQTPAAGAWLRVPASLLSAPALLINQSTNELPLSVLPAAKLPGLLPPRGVLCPRWVRARRALAMPTLLVFHPIYPRAAGFLGSRCPQPRMRLQSPGLLSTLCGPAAFAQAPRLRVTGPPQVPHGSPFCCSSPGSHGRSFPSSRPGSNRALASPGHPTPYPLP